MTAILVRHTYFMHLRFRSGFVTIRFFFVADVFMQTAVCTLSHVIHSSSIFFGKNILPIILVVYHSYFLIQ